MVRIGYFRQVAGELITQYTGSLIFVVAPGSLPKILWVIAHNDG